MYILMFISGAVFASFIHVYVTRTLKGESIVSPRSHCTNCNHTLAWYELIPILSYIIQRGRCTKCNIKIGVDSFISEIFLGIMFVIMYARFGLTYDTFVGCIISMMVLSICISDFREMVILDSTIVVSGVLFYAVTFGSLGLRGVYKSFLYGIFGFVLMFVVKILGDFIFKRESLGGGDIKLAFVMGSVLPYQLFLASLISGSFLALPYALLETSKTSSHELAFGPFLGLGLLLVFFFKNDIMGVLDTLVNIERIFL